VQRLHFSTIDEYIGTFPKDVQNTLRKLRQAIKEAAPDAVEAISYQMPAFRLRGNLVYFAAFKNHIGFYPTSSGIEAFKKELSSYETSKGAIRFPIGKPLPLSLITKIVRYRVKENLVKATKKTDKNK